MARITNPINRAAVAVAARVAAKPVTGGGARGVMAKAAQGIAKGRQPVEAKPRVMPVRPTGRVV